MSDVTDPTDAPTAPRRRPLRRLLVAAGLALAVVVPTAAVMAPSPASAATFGSVYAVSTAQYNCGAHTITVYPMTNERLNGGYSVYSYAQAFDRVSGRWITTGWLLDNGIQAHVFSNMRSFDPYVKVTYARYMYGAWVYKADWVQITSTLDSMGPFCNP